MLADLSYSRDREERIDFTAPFMNIGVGEFSSIQMRPIMSMSLFSLKFKCFQGMLFKNEHTRQLNVFSFLEPFTLEVWIMMLISYVLVSTVFYCISKHHER